MTPRTSSRAGRGRLPHHGRQGRHQAARRRHADQPPAAGDRAAARLPRGQADGVLRALPDRLRPLPRAARRAGEADAQRRRAELGARDLRRAGLRLPLRLPRPAAHGHRARAPGARVRPRADGDDARRSSSRSTLTDGDGHRGPQPDRHARPGAHRGDARALHPGLDPRAQGVRRPGHGALPGAPRRAQRHALPVGRARADHLRPAAGRDRARLLRPAEVAHARLRVARLRARSACARRTWPSSTSCSPASRSTRCRWSCTATRPTRSAGR